MSLRLRLPVLAIAALVVLAAGARASDFSFVWHQTSSTLPPVGGVPRVSPGDTAVLEIRVHADSTGIRGASISVEYDPELLHVIGYVRCPAAPGNPYGDIGGCGVIPEGGGFEDVLVPAFEPVIDNVLGRTGTLAAECFTPGCGQVDWTFELVHVTFEVQPLPSGVELPVATEVTHYYEPGMSGLFDILNFSTQPDVTPAALLIGPPAAVPALPGPARLLLAGALGAAGLRGISARLRAARRTRSARGRSSAAARPRQPSRGRRTGSRRGGCRGPRSGGR